MRSIATHAFKLLLLGVLTACAPNSAIQSSNLPVTETAVPLIASETAAPEATSTIVEEREISYKIAAFYYPWYGNPETDGKWIHWAQNNHLPPNDIGADYFPALGTYSSNDPAVVAQHME